MEVNFFSRTFLSVNYPIEGEMKRWVRRYMSLGMAFRQKMETRSQKAFLNC